MPDAVLRPALRGQRRPRGGGGPDHHRRARLRPLHPLPVTPTTPAAPPPGPHGLVWPGLPFWPGRCERQLLFWLSVADLIQAWLLLTFSLGRCDVLLASVLNASLDVLHPFSPIQKK